MARFGIESSRLYPRLFWAQIRAQNRLGLQGNPIQIPQVMDTAG